MTRRLSREERTRRAGDAAAEGKVTMQKTCPWPACGRVLTVRVSKQGKSIGSQYLAQNMRAHVGAHERKTGMRLKGALLERAQRNAATDRPEARPIEEYAGGAR